MGVTSDIIPDGVAAEKALFRKLCSIRPAHACSLLAAAAPERQQHFPILAAGALGDPSKGFLQNDVAKQSGSLLQGLGEGSEAKQSDKPLGFYFRRDAAEQAQADSSGSTAADMLRGGAQPAHRKNQASSSPAKNALGHYFSGEAGAQAAEAKGSKITPSKIKMARGQQWDAFRPRPLDKSKLPFETVR